MKHYLRKLLRSENLIADLIRPRISSTKKILIDYSSPNIAKRFHVGNFRSTILGRFIDSINRAAGNHVISFNYLGDWGTQFALIATYWPDFKPSDQLWQSCDDIEKLKLLTNCYVEANTLRKSDEAFSSKVQRVTMEMEDELIKGNLSNAYLKFWHEVRNISLNHLNDFYRDLNICHDVISAESNDVKQAREIVQDIIARGYSKKTADGLTVASFPSLEGYVVLKKSNDATLYFSRLVDLASILNRDTVYSADRYLYVVDRSQTRHFEFMKLLLTHLDRKDLADKIEHIPFGRVLGMSTRQGKTEDVSDIFEKGVELAQEFIQQSSTVKVSDEEIYDVAKKLSISTVIVNDIKRHRLSEYTFSFHGAFKMKQVNALLLQMKHSRLASLEKRNVELMQDLLSDWNYELEITPEILPLLNHMRSFDEALVAGFLFSEPCKVTTYLLKLANLTGSAMALLKVYDEPLEKALPRLLLFSTAKKILHEGMKLLGIDPLDKM